MCNGKEIQYWKTEVKHESIVTDLIKALPSNGSVNISQQFMFQTMCPVFSIPQNAHIEPLRNKATTIHQMKPLIGLHIIYLYICAPAALAVERL
jgi:hypothetical protein